MSKYRVVFFLISLLFFASITADSAQISGINPPDVISERRVWFPEEFLLYKEAFEKSLALSKPSQDFREIADEIMTLGWKENEEVNKLLNEYREVIDIFKRATAQESDGTIFGMRPQIMDLHSEIPQFFNTVLIVRLTLLEAKKYEASEDITKARENYLAATRFVLHLAQQKFRLLLTDLIELVVKDDVLIGLEGTLKNHAFGEEYCRELLTILKHIAAQQDFMRGAIETERIIAKSSIDIFETGGRHYIFEDKLTTDEFFEMVMNGKKNNKLIQKDKKGPVVSPKILDEFYGSLRKYYEKDTNSVFDTWIASSQNNDPQPLYTLINERKEEYERFGKRIHRFYWFYYWGERIKGKSNAQINGEIFAYVFANVSLPDYAGSVEQYHIIHTRLALAIAATAVKLYQSKTGDLPVDLEKLVPEYIDSVPLDAYNGFQPIKYINYNEDIIVYSIGPDRKDDGGRVAFQRSRDKLSSAVKEGDILLRFKDGE